MKSLEKFKSFEIGKSFQQQLSGGEDCQYYENLCMQTAHRDGNLFLLDDCDALCP